MPKDLRIKVVGSGINARNYTIYDADTDEEIRNVQSLRVEFDAQEQIVAAELVVLGIELDISDIPAGTTVIR